MKEKVLLILSDGMRSDSLTACGNPYYEEFLKESRYALNAQTVMPSVTLPCHMSLFHSVEPNRHGILTNTYTPPVRPIEGIVEQITKFGGKCAMFYDWEQLRDLSRPGNLKFAYAPRAGAFEGKYRTTLQMMLKEASSFIPSEKPDFVFFYIGATDSAGHDKGWMTPEYLESVSESWDAIKTLTELLGDEYTIIVTADHGGHDRTHGTELPEDMTIPVICRGKRFTPGDFGKDVSILDIAPTITDLLGIMPNEDWDGKSVL